MSQVTTNEAPEGRCSRDAGFSLVEIVATITLVALIVLPILNAAFGAVKASATSREVAEIETVLQNAADRVNRADIDCDYSLYVGAAAAANGWPASRATATYQHYVPGATAAASTPGTWADGACPGGVRVRGMVQLVTITVVSDTGSIRRSIKVVKSDV